MEIFDSLNQYLLSHPDMMSQLQFAFVIKWWLLLILALFFFYLPYHERKKKLAKKTSIKDGQFLA